MCIQDIAISRRCYTKQTETQPNVAVRLAPSPDRLAVILTSQVSGSTLSVISPSKLSADSIMGYVVTSCNNAAVSDVASTAECSLNYRDHPGIVQQELWVETFNAAGIVTEVIMQDDLANELRQMLQTQISQYRRR